ncbi:MAG: DUF2263 domain-containing protein [Legionella sp.]|nr:DUF2263 domain-containing protein [Legionella sp.]
MVNTINSISSPEKLKALQDAATQNFSSWEAKKQPFPGKIEVIKQDWGQAALEATQQYGCIYPILNYANDKHPGGDFLRLGNAQEENLWQRTTCALSLFQGREHFDDSKKEFVYKPWMSQLIAAQTKMSGSEQAEVQHALNLSDAGQFKVFLNANPEVCFRGPEVRFDSGMPGSNEEILVPDMSLEVLPSKLMFPFYELRSSAPLLVPNEINLGNTEQVQHYKQVLRQRIAAQLDTLVLNGFKHAILGAWGCGCFNNDPKIVAEIYREEIEKRAEYFTHLLFPVTASSHSNTSNFSIFREYLDDIDLKKYDVNQDSDVPSGPSM